MENIKNIIIKILIVYLLVITSLVIYQNPEFNLGSKILYCANLLYFYLKFKTEHIFLYEYYLSILIYIIGFYLLIYNQNKSNEKLCLIIIANLPHIHYGILKMNIRR